MFSFSNPGPFFGPAEALAVYQGLPCATPDGEATVGITQYRNANNSLANGGTQEAEKLKNALLQVAPDALSRAGGAVAYVDVFLGKGSPQAIVAVLETFVDYADKFIRVHGKSKGTAGECAALLGDPVTSWQETLQQISDGWLGLDCNGFVGNWLKVVAPQFKLNQNSKSKDARAIAKAVRQSVAEIEYWDIMCYAGNEHIAAVNDKGDTPGTFAVCQSAGGGPRMNDYRFLPAGDGKFRLAPTTPQDIGGAFYVVSLW